MTFFWKKESSCLNSNSFWLIYKSSKADELSEYQIQRLEDKIYFKSNGYTLFFLELNPENETVKLIGLDGYGIRDKKFNRYICRLVKKLELFGE